MSHVGFSPSRLRPLFPIGLRRTALLRGGVLTNVLALTVLLLIVAGCGTTPAPSTSGGKIQVVAAENFWGSIAAQVGGDHVKVTSIIVNPDTDPHDYEATPADARTIASAGYVIFNGVGYDPWVRQLLEANPVTGRSELEIGT